MGNELNRLIHMTERLQVLFAEDEYRDIQRTAREHHMTVAEWVRQTLRSARRRQHRAVETKLKAVADAVQHGFPTADIDTMLREIERGYSPE